MINNNIRSRHPVRARRKPVNQSGVNLNVDVPLLLTTFTLLVFGAIMVYSASWDFSRSLYDDPSRIFSRQINWMLIGLVVAAVTALLDYHYWRLLAVPAMLFTLLGLLAVLLISEVVLGASRTINAGSYMPSEAAKLSIIVYLSVWLYSKRNFLADISLGLIPLGVIVGLVAGMILLQPDLSAAATVIFLGGMLFFLAGGDLKQIAGLLVLIMFVGWFVVQIMPTGRTRIASYLEGIKDPTDASYHVRRSIEAFVNGGLFGVGIGNSDTKVTGLPVPPTDSIFAVVAEETGLIGAVGLMSLYLIIVWRGIRIAKRAPDQLGSLLAAGLSFWIALEAMINMAVMVNLVPFAGNALPFISAGGSNLMVTLAAIGILLNISRLSAVQDAAPARRADAPDGVRRS